MSFSNFPSVAIIILNWNNWQNTVECLESLAQIDYPNYQIIVVDNGSSDGSVAQLKQRFDGIRLFETGKNLGFSGGVNYGIEQAKNTDLILLLNNDTIVAQNFLTELVKTIRSNDTIGLVGGKIYYCEETECDAFMHRQPNKIWSAGGGISRFTKRTFHFGEKKNDRGQFDQKREVDFLSGCCLLIKREVIEKIGLLDSDYFMYYEDVDFCLRVKERGYKIHYTPRSIIWHKTGGSSNRSFIDYYRMRNYLLLLKKRFLFSNAKLILISLPVLLERMARILLRKLIYRDADKISARFSGLFRGFEDGLAWQK